MSVRPSRAELNAILEPSRDQTGKELREFEVSGDSVPRARSCNQISINPVSGSRRSNATVVPSGEIAGQFRSVGGPTVPKTLPERSNHVSCTFRPTAPEV